MRWTIAVLCFVFLGHRLYVSYDSFAASFSVMFSNTNLPLFVLLVVLMFLNWGIESLKWKLGAGVVSPITFPRAITSVLAGIAVSMVGPNRTGEFIGRITALPAEKRTAGAFVSVHISLAQTIVTLIAGLAAWLLMGCENLPLSSGRELLSALVILATVFLFILYFRFVWVYALLQRKPFSRWFRNTIPASVPVKNRLLIINLLLSMLRYGIFISQFVIAFRIFGLQVSVPDLYLASALIYLLMAAVPSFALAELGVRGTLSVFVMGAFSAEAGPVIAASSLLWIINIAIPASAGAVVLASEK